MITALGSMVRRLTTHSEVPNVVLYFFFFLSPPSNSFPMKNPHFLILCHFSEGVISSQLCNWEVHVSG